MPLKLFGSAAQPKSRQAVVASGKRMDLGASSIGQSRTGIPLWQQQAWSYYDQIGEVRYGARFFGNSLSRLRMFVGWREDLSSPVVPVDVDDLPSELNRVHWQVASDNLFRLHNTDGSLSGLLRQYGVNLFVSGECYLVGRTDADTGMERWDMLSVDQVVYHDGKQKIKLDVADTPDKFVPLSEDEDVLVRVWQPHPRFNQQADSPLRAVLPLCEELLLLSASVRASALSRMSAGVLVLPDTALEGGPTLDVGGSGVDGEGGSDPVLQTIMDHFVEPIGDPASAAAVAPYLLALDPQDCDKVKLLDTSRSVDATAAAQRAEVLVRIANGVDLPPEVLQGLSNTNHWNAWLIDEQSYKSHIAPAAQLFADAITEGLVWPAVRAATGADPDPRMVVGFDPVDLVAHADVRGAAKDAHSALVLSDEALRRSLGFSEDDAPDEDEYKRRVSVRQGSTALVPVAVGEVETVLESLEEVRGEDLSESDDAVDESNEPGPPEEPLTASAARGVDLGERLGRIDRQLFDTLQGYLDAAMKRALDKAGARVRSKLSRRADMKSVLEANGNRELVKAVGRSTVYDLDLTDDELLDGAFDDLAEDFDVLVARAQRRARRILIDDYGLDDDEAVGLESRQDDGRAAAVVVLTAAVVAEAVRRLYQPTLPATPDPARLGQLGAQGVPSNVLRGALQTAGGGQAAAGPPTASPGATPGLVATGPDVRESAKRVGLIEAGFIWSYGDAMRETFEPHFALDGKEFGGWEDPRLANPDAWPPVPFFFPGDHEFCRCSAVPVYRAVAFEESGGASE